jgi:type VI protein secretion system component Hcp
MKKICFVIYVLLCTVVLHAQNVGIGTQTPDNSAIVDIASTSKGLLLPRLADTTSVSTPATGLVIYNQNTKSPNYYDGAKWKDVADARNNFVPLQGNITYTITGTTAVGGISVDAGPLAAVEYSNISTSPRSVGGGGGGTSRPTGMDSIIIYKEFDGNSIIFKRAHLGGSTIQGMEISQFLPNAATPFYSIKLTNFTVNSQSYFISEKTGKLTEKYGLLAQIIGYKDWVNNKSFSFNVGLSSFGVY